MCEKSAADAPEREGWLERDKLHAFSGRSRKPQTVLAAHYGFEDCAQPTGGCCFLTDRQYSLKLSDLWQTCGDRDYELDDIMLLKVERHLRPRPYFKLIVGREEGENRYSGPLVLLDGEAGADTILNSPLALSRASARDVMPQRSP